MGPGQRSGEVSKGWIGSSTPKESHGLSRNYRVRFQHGTTNRSRFDDQCRCKSGFRFARSWNYSRGTICFQSAGASFGEIVIYAAGSWLPRQPPWWIVRRANPPASATKQSKLMTAVDQPRPIMTDSSHAKVASNVPWWTQHPFNPTLRRSPRSAATTQPR